MHYLGRMSKSPLSQFWGFLIFLGFALLLNLYINDKYEFWTYNLNGNKYRIMSPGNWDTFGTYSIDIYLKGGHKKNANELVSFVKDFHVFNHLKSYEELHRFFYEPEQDIHSLMKAVDTIGKYNINLRRRNIKRPEENTRLKDHTGVINVEEKNDSILCISIIWDYPDRVPIDTCIVLTGSKETSIKQDVPLNTPSLKGVRTME